MKSDPQARPAEVTDEDVLTCLGGHPPAGIRELADTLGLRHRGRRALPRVLAGLVRRGKIEKLRDGRFRLRGLRPTAVQPGAPPPMPKSARDPNLISGRIVVHRDGYGFVVPAEAVPRMEGDLFVGREQLGDAMHGDRVLARIERRRADGRAEGRVVQILEREHPTVVGRFRYGPRENVVLPYDTRLLHEVFIPPGEELTPALRQKLGAGPAGKSSLRRTARLPELDGAVVNVEITRYPKGGVAPAGRVIEILGRPGEMGVDVEIIIRKHHLPHGFPAEALGEARAAARPIAELDLAGRRDFRSLPIVTIDGETARDFDDAVYVGKRADGGWGLQVHIADVSHYVRRGSAMDQEARLRGTSAYFPDRALPMLPEELSNGICSLNPRVDRLVMSVLMEFEENGRMEAAEFLPGVIRSAARMTYTDVNKALEGDAEANLRFASLANEFRKMRELALVLNRKRYERGSIDFDLPEPVIEFDALGRMVGITRSERNIAHRIIEEFMLAANEAVARALSHAAVLSLHRVHEKPDPKKVLEFEEVARTFGYSLGVADLAERRVPVRHGRSRPAARVGRTARGRMRPMSVALPAEGEMKIRPQHYQRLTEKIAGRPEERILSYLMLRSLRQAHYAAKSLGHFALALAEYAHFTSPIRRYPDLVVHRILHWALAELPEFSAKMRFAAAGSRAGSEVHPEGLKGEKIHRGPYRPVELEEIAEESSEAERRADAAERELMDWKTVQFMESRLGEEYDALIISVQKFGFFVELLDVFVEGLVPIDRLEEISGERCFHRERDHAIVTEKSRRAYRLGDRLRVRAERIDLFRNRVEFSVV